MFIQILDNNLLLFGLITFALLGVIFASIEVMRLKKRIKIFFDGSRAEDLEELMSQEFKRIKNLEEAVKKLTEEYKKTQGISLKSLHRVGIVRFNPFKDTGGDQSFVVALLDAKNNGVILSSLYTREGTRIYAKPINNRESKYGLSNEEKEALDQAIQFKN